MALEERLFVARQKTLDAFNKPVFLDHPAYATSSFKAFAQLLECSGPARDILRSQLKQAAQYDLDPEIEKPYAYGFIKFYDPTSVRSLKLNGLRVQRVTGRKALETSSKAAEVLSDAISEFFYHAHKHKPFQTLIVFEQHPSGQFAAAHNERSLLDFAYETPELIVDEHGYRSPLAREIMYAYFLPLIGSVGLGHVGDALKLQHQAQLFARKEGCFDVVNDALFDIEKNIGSRKVRQLAQAYANAASAKAENDELLTAWTRAIETTRYARNKKS